MARRAEFDVQLNWVFILIAGTVILTFFFAVIQKQKEFSERKLADSLRIGFDGIFTGAQSASDTVFTMGIPDQGVDFSCSSECDCQFAVGRVSHPFNDKVVFSAPRVRGPQMTLWALDIGLPFRVTTFLFVTSSANQFVFIVNDPAQNELFREFSALWPENLSRVVVSPSEIPKVINQNYEHTSFISFEELPAVVTLNETFRDASVSGVVLSRNDRFYNARFYRKYTQSQQLRLDGTAHHFVPSMSGLVGAAFAGSRDMYKCNMRSTMNRLAILGTLYANRTADLISVSPAHCPYGTSSQIFSDLSGLARTAATSPDDLSSQFTTIVDDLARINNQLVSQSCPLLY